LLEFRNSDDTALIDTHEPWKQVIDLDALSTHCIATHVEGHAFFLERSHHLGYLFSCCELMKRLTGGPEHHEYNVDILGTAGTFDVVADIAERKLYIFGVWDVVNDFLLVAGQDRARNRHAEQKDGERG